MTNTYTLIAAIIAFGVTALLGFKMIPYLRKLKFGQTIREEGPAWHQKKQGTPTMGGIMFIIGTAVALMVAVPLWLVKTEGETMLAVVRVLSGFIMAAAMGLVGFMDDFISIKKHRNLGLTEIQKLVLQFLIVGAYLFSVKLAGGTSEMLIPYIGTVDWGIFYYILAAIFIVGMINAVNFTDGIDGLNGTVTFVVALGFMVTAYYMNYMGVAILAAACAGGCIGFLIWNFNPAKVFMGDTGSLFLGGMVCALAFGLNIPIMLIIYGIVYIIEIVSVVLQVTYFKLTKGKRLFKMSPIHHHFELCGWNEVKICAVFGLVSLIACAVGTVMVVTGL